MTPITTSELASELGARLVGDGDVGLTDVSHDSRAVGPGALFVAIRGLTSDGHRYVDGAIERGAAAICVERAAARPVPEIIVTDTRQALGPAASAVHGHPSSAIKVVGVTGTNGKTTVTQMVGSISAHAGLRPGLIGTVGARIGDTPIELARTTPEASDFQRLLRRMADAGVSVVATEVSSHAMTLHRVDGTRFALVAFTGLSQDHLDFHGSMDAYFAAKAQLFDRTFSDTAVINVNDPWGRRLREKTDLDVVSIGEDIRVTELVERPGASHFMIHTPAGTGPCTLPIGGHFNVENALVAAGIGLALGLDLSSVVQGLERLPPIPGRFEQVPDPAGRFVIVDYAHTPDGIQQVVASAAQVSEGRVFAVLGAAGDRDTAKRPLMGESAATADVAVITSDNPRSEDPEAIIRAVVEGIGDGPDYHVEVDRRAAIRWALEHSGPGDVVLILGKGHETGQEYADRTIPFDDRLVTAEEIALLGDSSGIERWQP